MVYLLCDVKCICACEYRCFHLFSAHSHLVGKDDLQNIGESLKILWRWFAFIVEWRKMGKMICTQRRRSFLLLLFFPSGFIIRLFCSCSTLYSVILHFWLDNSTDHFIITMYQAHIRTLDFYAIDVSANYFEILMVITWKLSIFHMFFFNSRVDFLLNFHWAALRAAIFAWFFYWFFRKSFSNIIL